MGRFDRLRTIRDATTARGDAHLAYVNAEDAKSLEALGALSGPFLPWTTFSMRPTAILAAVSDAIINDRRQIVECGSGNSTIYLARLLAQNGTGHIHTVEHDAAWAAVTRRLLAREGLEAHATVVDAPLGDDAWYDRSAIPDIPGIDLLVVDGPPAHEGRKRTARSPALDVFGPSLAEGATVMLDDAWREGERAVIDDWTDRFDRRFAHSASGGHAISAPYTA